MSDDEPEEQAPQADPPAASEAAPIEAPPPPARRKKRRRVAREAAAEAPREAPEPDDEAAPENADEDDGIPAFARAFPRDPALDALVTAFEAGDYARVRREAPALARQTESDAVRAAARDLARRLDPDPIAVYLLAAAALLLVFLAGWYWAHPHTP